MTRRRTALLRAAALLLAAGSAVAAPVTYDIDPDHTRVWWEVRHFATSTQRGRFDDIAGLIVLDREKARGEVSIRIATASVSSGVPALDRMLRSDHFLASDAHPEAWFVAGRVSFDGDRLGAVRGEFTLRGVSRPLELRALRFACRHDEARHHEVCGGDFEAEFRRSDHGSTFGLPFVGDTVRLLIAVEGVER
ncbi:MAG TPA: YceI family protein [Albitalea sp.]